ncbi:MAG: HAMP domain-containing protein [Flavobacteriales bacterium]|nr:HAMP domain-containing protein [Flavobacteriales bacterium]
MRISITLRIWLTVAIIVLIFTILIMYIVPNQQEKYFINTFNTEIQNLAKTVALGTNIALIENNFEGIQVAMDFAKSDSRLEFVAIREIKPPGEKGRQFKHTYPPDYPIDSMQIDSQKVIVKHAPFSSEMMSGEILVGFKTDEIKSNMHKVRVTAMILSVFVFLFGILLGLWLARTISKPVKAIRDAAVKVGQGDLTQYVGNRSKDEIGDLSRAFNNMVNELSSAEAKIREKNQALIHTLEDLENKNQLLSDEKKKSDNLLLNILPKETANELKQFGSCIPRMFESVTVMFTDFVKFTNISEKMTPEELVKEIDYCFRNFDKIILKYELEKIKTIGDSYMCAGGLPQVTEDHALKCTLAALEIQEFLMEHKTERLQKNLPVFEARIGLNSGPVVAGVVGSNKFAYDIWGDTVNTSSRIETSGEVNRVNISHSTYLLIKENPMFKFEFRGEISAKNKGELQMYFVNLV